MFYCELAMRPNAKVTMLPGGRHDDTVHGESGNRRTGRLVQVFSGGTVLQYKPRIVSLAGMAGFGLMGLAGCGSAPTADVGDCIDSANIPGDVSELPTVSCDDPHDLEIFHAFDLEEGEFLGDDAMNAEAEDQCIPAFEDYVGIGYQQSDIFITTILPSQETWDIGDREVLCALESNETTSLENAQH